MEGEVRAARSSELAVAVTDAQMALVTATEDVPRRDTPEGRYHNRNGDTSRNRERNGSERRNRERDRERFSRESAVSLSCVLNILDGVEAIDGKIIVCTTNALQSLDPALIRPGRIDLFLEFRRATRLVAEQLFHSFYQPSSTGMGIGSDNARKEGKDAFPALKKREGEEAVVPDLARQAQAWASFIDDDEFSLAELQGEERSATVGSSVEWRLRASTVRHASEPQEEPADRCREDGRLGCEGETGSHNEEKETVQGQQDEQHLTGIRAAVGIAMQSGEGIAMGTGAFLSRSPLCSAQSRDHLLFSTEMTGRGLSLPFSAAGCAPSASLASWYPIDRALLCCCSYLASGAAIILSASLPSISAVRGLAAA